jgi:voltage-gated potassium channel
MAFIEGNRANDPGSSPRDAFSDLGELKALLPYALAFLSADGPDSGYTGLKQELRDWAKKDPLDALVAVVLGGGIAFYIAERESNPACNSPWDGILYMSTALSVGYDNLFPTTSAGHALATFAQTFGPALANAAFDPPAAEKLAAEAEAAATNKAILARLEDIVRLLEAKV